jgi:cytochrome c553
MHRNTSFSFTQIGFFIFLLVLLSSNPCLFAGTLISKSGEEDHDDHLKSSEVRRGERLFYGLISDKGTAPACATCHNTLLIDTLNWYPSAWEISNLYKEKDIEDFRKVLLSPTTAKMTEIHRNFNFTEEDVVLIKGFLDYFQESGLQPPKPVINNLLLFLFLGFLITFALVDLIFLHKLKARFIHLIVILLALGWQIKMVAFEAIALGRSEHYSPDQPIKFSHKIHAGENKIDCYYCHSTAEYSKSAGIPSVNICMNCHILIREGTNSGRYEINKIHFASENHEPIKWIRVHNLPDHVFFSHAQHIGVAGLDCNECHGKVEEMYRIEQVTDMAMGWCINCHRTKEVGFYDNEFYTQYEQMHEDLKSGKIDKITVDKVGGTDCMKCHY